MTEWKAYEKASNRFVPPVPGAILSFYLAAPMEIRCIATTGATFRVLTDNNGIIVTKQELEEVIDAISDFYDLYDDSAIARINHNTLSRQENSTLTAQEHQPPDYSGYVYILQCNMYYKIGKSKDPEKRTAQISPKLPFPTVLIHTIKTVNMSMTEKTLHTRYAHRRQNGEWFTLSDDELNEIKAIPQAGE